MYRGGREDIPAGEMGMFHWELKGGRTLVMLTALLAAAAAALEAMVGSKTPMWCGQWRRIDDKVVDRCSRASEVERELDRWAWSWHPTRLPLQRLGLLQTRKLPGSLVC